MITHKFNKNRETYLKSFAYLGMVCWNPWRYSCSKAGTTNCRRFHREASSLRRAGGAGSRHSGKNTMKDNGSKVSSNNLSKWTMVASINSSQKGGFASKEPQWGLKSITVLKDINFSWNRSSTTLNFLLNLLKILGQEVFNFSEPALFKKNFFCSFFFV